MLPFSVSLQSGEPLVDQVVYAVTRAIVTGQLRVDDPFPSVRTLSQELKINPNTAHKIVAALVDQGFLHVRPGIGTVEARKIGVGLQEVLAAVRRHWTRLVRRAG